MTRFSLHHKVSGVRRLLSLESYLTVGIGRLSPADSRGKLVERQQRVELCELTVGKLKSTRVGVDRGLTSVLIYNRINILQSKWKALLIIFKLPIITLEGENLLRSWKN